MENKNDLIPFEGQAIRKIWHDEQWYFSVVDIIGFLTDSKDPSQYWKRLNQRDKELKGTVQIVPLLLSSAGGKQKVLCSNIEGIFRIVMSVPSFKPEPLKVWLAEQGRQAIEETENPELLTERQAEIYRAKGYTQEWIKERLQSINTRKLLTDEWKNRGVKECQEYGLLTAIIAKGTFGITPTEHKDIKGLDKPTHNLRDHMTDLELILTALGEAVTRTIAIDEDAQGFNENKEAAVKGGQAGGQARRNVEKITGKKVVTPTNFLPKNADAILGENIQNTEGV